jgi:hypothetical protein
MFRTFVTISVLCAGLLLTAMAHAQSEQPEGNKFFVGVGGFWPDVNTTVRVDGNGGVIGTKLDFESDLGLDDRKALFTGLASWHIAKRHYLELMYFRLARSGTHDIDVDIRFRDKVFSAQSTLNSFFDTDVLRISYGYAFYDNGKSRLIGQAGAHYTQVSTGITLKGAGSVTADAKAKVPLPVIGLQYDYQFTPKMSLDARAQIFRLSFDGIDGALNNLSATFQYGFTPQFGAFIGYNYYSLNVDADREQWHGSFDFSYSGPWLGVSYGFGKM